MLSFIAERSREDASALMRPSGETLTYASLAMAAAAVEQALTARVGDVARRAVGIFASDGAQRLAALLAVLEAGGVALPLDERVGLAQARAQARTARAVALIVGDAGEDRLDIEPVDPARLTLPPESALLLGRGPQRAVFSRAAVVAAVDALVQSQSLTAATRMALFTPGAAAAMLVGQALATLRAGGTLLDVGQLEPAAQLATLVRLDGNTIFAFPPQLDALTRAVLDHGATAPPLDRVIVQAATLPAPLAEAAQQAFPHATLINLQRSADSLHITPPEPRDAGTTTEAASSAMPESIEVEGERLDPQALEAELRALPGVREVALLIVPDARLGPRPIAFVTLAETQAAVTLPPVRVVIVAALPRTPDGTLNHEALRRMASPD
jgi:acyl-CoA synthetase (AMP-forming)/AMP-acid ligase II